MTDDEEELLEEKKNRRARRAEQAGATEDGPIKDRNQRVRAQLRTRAPQGARGAEPFRSEDLLSRSAEKTGRLVQAQFPWLQWVVVLGLAAGVGAIIYGYQRTQKREQTGDRLAAVLEISNGRIASDSPLEPSDPNLVDTRPEFASAEERAKKAAEQWEELQGGARSELRILSRLAEAAALYDAKNWAGARQKYESVAQENQASALHRARATEGLGLTWEAEGNLEQARAAFAQLDGYELKEYKQLGRFHEARILFLQGEKEKAKEELTRLNSELSRGSSPFGPRNYMVLAVEDLLKTVDPEAASSSGGITPEQLEELRKQIEAMQQGGNLELPTGDAPEGPNSSEGTSSP